MKEQWKIWKYNGKKTRYKISNMGQVHDTKKDIFTYGNKTADGYLKYTFYLDDGKAVSKLIHRLVAELFVHNPDKRYDIVDHINCNKMDNRASNLRWCTNAMNIQYAMENGLMKKSKGLNSTRRKYTKEQILAVIEMLKSGKYKARDIALITGVNVHLVRDLRHKRVYVDEVSGLELSLQDGIRKFSDAQILEVISLLNGKFTVKEISEKTGVSKIIVRSICKRLIYKDFTKDIENLSYKKISSRASKEDILKAISLLETKKFTGKELSKITGLSISVLEKLVYHERWTKLTEGKELGFKNSK